LDLTQLISECLNFFDAHWECVISNDHFLDVSLEMIEKILDRDTLIVSEINLYEALVRWSEEECRRRSLEVKVENQQQVLATILPKVRFPLMTQNDFAAKVFAGKLLNPFQTSEMIMWFWNDAKPQISFTSKPRKGSPRPEYSVSIITAISGPSKTFEMEIDHNICLTGFGTQVNESDDPEAGQNNLNVRGPDGFHRHDFTSRRLSSKHGHYSLTFLKTGELKTNFCYFKKTIKKKLENQNDPYYNDTHSPNSYFDNNNKKLFFQKLEQQVFIKELNKDIKFTFYYKLKPNANLKLTKLYFHLSD
jgi:hypothetical protein